jgi:hypothetical protein
VQAVARTPFLSGEFRLDLVGDGDGLRDGGLLLRLARLNVEDQLRGHRVTLKDTPAAPAQFNSAYMLVYFIGGTLGTAFGAAAVGWFGWPATTAIAAGAIALAMIITITVRGNSRSLG